MIKTILPPEAEAKMIAAIKACPVKWEQALDGDRNAIDWLRWAGGKNTGVWPLTIDAWLEEQLEAVRYLDDYTEDWSHSRIPQLTRLEAE